MFKPVQENRFSSPGGRKCVSKREAALIKSTSESGDNRDTRFGESLETVRRWSWNGGQLELWVPKVMASGGQRPWAREVLVLLGD